MELLIKAVLPFHFTELRGNMPATYEPIATQTLGSAASAITFTSIPATYTDLRVVLVGTTSSADYYRFRFNNDTSSLYSITSLYGDGSTATSGRFSNSASIFVLNPTSTTVPTTYQIDLFSYAGSTNKTCLVSASGDRNGSGEVWRSVGLYRSTSAIDRIDLLAFSGAVNLAANTTATLYGIKNA